MRTHTWRLAAFCLTAALAAGWAGCGEDSEDSDTSGSMTEGAIGAEGGEVTHSSGLTITVPEGALAEESMLMIKEVSDPASVLPAGPEGFGYLSGAYEFLPHGQSFDRAVDVFIPLDGVPGSAEVRVVRLDDLSDTTWEQIPDATITASGATFTISRFSVYAIIAATEGGGENNGTTGGTSNATGGGTTGGDTGNGTTGGETTPDEPDPEPDSEPSSKPSG